MLIGELALKTGVSARALRHYEAQGLIESTRLDNGYRDYAEAVVARVQWIKELIDCGFSTRQVEGLAGLLGAEDQDDQRFIACLMEHSAKLHALDTLIDLLLARRAKLAARISQYSPATADSIDR